ncbi:MAG TPA: transposase [Oligoflexus sp.]|uniref:IS66 family transposase n=1 Tax=Oligoflexus sp. TaxID=1971216 RepID=UPI002D4732F1|nr:transposase [Oligoflexus sp.]HYX37265.1 transposase [Oligoflexus sp.]
MQLKKLGKGCDSLSEIELIIADRLSISQVHVEKALEKTTSDEQQDTTSSSRGQANEELTGEPLARREVVEETWRADRSGFAPGASLHSSYDLITRYETEIVVKERRIRVETVTDLYSGKSVRADLSSLGPERSKITWASIALLICLAIEAAMPFDRLRKVLFSAFGIFSTSSICRYFQAAAQKLVHVYLWLITELAHNALILAGDDSSTRCIEMEIKATRGLQDGYDGLDPLVKLVAEKLGRSFSYKNDPKKPKGGIFVSHVHGRTVPADPRSTIYIYRTHYGHYGNLLSRMLAIRPASAPKVIIQGDLSPSNFPEPLLMVRWISRFIGCASHARRPFKRYEEDDPQFTDRMLELFTLISAAERSIFASPRQAAEIVRLRLLLEKPVWEEIRELALSVIDAEKRKSAQNRLHQLWPKKSPLYKGCSYIVRHFPELTAYLEDPRLESSNNRAERLLRAEKMLLVSAKFRKSEVGRVSLDILRSLIMTAKAAEASPKAYLSWVLAQPEKDIEKNPQDYTPLAYRRRINSASSSQATGS